MSPSKLGWEVDLWTKFPLLHFFGPWIKLVLFPSQHLFCCWLPESDWKKSLPLWPGYDLYTGQVGQFGNKTTHRLTKKSLQSICKLSFPTAVPLDLDWLCLFFRLFSGWAHRLQYVIEISSPGVFWSEFKNIRLFKTLERSEENADVLSCSPHRAFEVFIHLLGCSEKSNCS